MLFNIYEDRGNTLKFRTSTITERQGRQLIANMRRVTPGRDFILRTANGTVVLRTR